MNNSSGQVSHFIPTSSNARISSLDILRGFALLGILAMNIQAFAMVGAAYFNPSLHMDLSGVNRWVWALSHVVADMKFMALFSMLFGAGIVLATERRDAQGVKWAAFRHFYWRNTWLLIFGLIHAYLIWAGDILVSYAIAGFVVFWFRRLGAPLLILAGGLFLSVAPLLSLSAGLAPEDVLSELVLDWTPSPSQIAAEIAAYRGSWGQAFEVRAVSSTETILYGIPFYIFWRAGGLMILGMGLFKLGILSARRSAKFYGWMMGLSFAVGLPLVLMSAYVLMAANWDPLFAQFGLGLLPNYVGSVFMALGYMAIIMRLVQTGLFAQIQARLAAIGRLAFSNYILHSLICTSLFYGFGLGLFGLVERWGQILIVWAIWLLQLWLSPLWLARFHFGPLEWLWRTLTYLKVQLFSRSHGAS